MMAPRSTCSKVQTTRSAPGWAGTTVGVPLPEQPSKSSPRSAALTGQWGQGMAVLWLPGVRRIDRFASVAGCQPLIHADINRDAYGMDRAVGEEELNDSGMGREEVEGLGIRVVQRSPARPRHHHDRRRMNPGDVDRGVRCGARAAGAPDAGPRRLDEQ